MLKSALKSLLPAWTRRARSAERIVRQLGARVLPFDRTFRFAGYKVYYQPGNALVARVRKAGGTFEPELTADIVTLLRDHPNPVLLDIGANIGLITLAVVRAVPNARVYAFEPGPTQYALLRKTILKNTLSDTIASIEAAAADTKGVVSFFTHTGGGDAKDGLKDTGRAASTHQIEVPSITLDAWIQSIPIPSISAIKIDTEGAELLVLRGARNVLRRFKPRVYFELDERNLKPYPYEPEDIVKFFLEENYSVQTLDKKPVSSSNVRESMKSTDTFVAMSAIG